MVQETCIENKSNIGLTRCNKLPNMFAGMVTTPVTFSISDANTQTAALAKTALQTAIKNGIASRVYIWPDFSSFEDASEEAVYEETPLTDLKVRDGKYRWRVSITKSLCLHKAMYTHNGGNQRVFFYDIAGNIFGTVLSDGSFAGFNLSLLNVEKLKIGDGSISTKSPIYVVLKDSSEIDEAGALLDAPFYSELIPLTDVILTTQVISTTVVKVTVKNACDGTPVSGLVKDDFVFLTGVGAAQTPDTVVELTGTGVYTATRAAFFVDGNVNLVAASALSIDAYESLGAATYDIP